MKLVKWTIIVLLSLTILYPLQGVADEVQIRAAVPGAEIPIPPTIPTAPPPFIFNIKIINITDTSATITWNTNEPADSLVEFGTSEDYDLSFHLADLVMFHEMILRNLKPDTLYHFRVISTNALGGTAISRDNTFKTQKDITPPENVTEFTAIPADQRIILTWLNPPDKDFAGVLIKMSDQFYPQSPDEGETVYNGKGEWAIVNNLKNGQRYYFTAFAYDNSKNYASGAIASAAPQALPIPPVVPPEIPPEIPPIVPPIAPPEVPIIPEIPPFVEVEKLTPKDIQFFQDFKEIIPDEEGRLKLDPKKPISVEIVFEKLPLALKTITFTLSTDKISQSFLLRINKEKTAYEATFRINEAGEYKWVLMIMNYLTKTLEKIKGILVIQAAEAAFPEGTKTIVKIPGRQGYWWLFAVLAILLTILWYEHRRHKLKKLKT